MPGITHSASPRFASRLLAWFAAAMRPLPWRRDYRPYEVWLSEIMLQQTQMERGVRFFTRWIERFPDIPAVAAAPEDAVLAAWEGLGYYSRARNLHAAARVIVDRHGGRFPDNLAAIRALPGVGDYTAGAIASIAFNLSVPAVDANVLRIATRLLDIAEPPSRRAVRRRVEAAVMRHMPPDQARFFNQALMELGALVCAKTPACAACPVAGCCLARRRGTTALRPALAAAPRTRRLTRAAAVILDPDGTRVFVRKRPPGGLWAGLWEFPDTEVPAGTDPAAALARAARDWPTGPLARIRPVAVIRHGYTTNQVTLHGYRCHAAPDPATTDSDAAGRWLPLAALPTLAFAAGQRKLLEKLGYK